MVVFIQFLKRTCLCLSGGWLTDGVNTKMFSPFLCFAVHFLRGGRLVGQVVSLVVALIVRVLRIKGLSCNNCENYLVSFYLSFFFILVFHLSFLFFYVFAYTFIYFLFF